MDSNSSSLRHNNSSNNNSILSNSSKVHHNAASVPVDVADITRTIVHHPEVPEALQCKTTVRSIRTKSTTVKMDVDAEVLDDSSVATTATEEDAAWVEAQEAHHVVEDIAESTRTTTNKPDRNNLVVCRCEVVACGVEVLVIHAVEHGALVQDQEAMLELAATITPSRTQPLRAPHKPAKMSIARQRRLISAEWYPTTTKKNITTNYTHEHRLGNNDQSRVWRIVSLNGVSRSGNNTTYRI